MGNIVQRISPSVDSSTGASNKIIAQAQSSHQIYKLVQPPNSYSKDGRGVLVDEAANCFKNKDYSPLHHKIREELKQYVYNDGEGKDLPVKDIIQKRIEERAEKAKKAKKRSTIQSILDSNVQTSSPSSLHATGEDTRLCCWDIDKRGALGETALHVCFLNNTTVHNILAKEIIKVYPNLLHDIYIGDEYYGENVLHMSLANENSEMVKFILREGKKVGLKLQERCFGKFFSPNDQGLTRYDVAYAEEVGVDPNTNYKGLVYWGEYPLSFAACSHQKELFEVLLKSGADLLAEDTNGNNVLHMMVIHNNKDMFNYCYDAAGEKQRELLEAKNRQHLTPLTLSAKLANKDMLDHILELKRDVAWVFGDVTCAHYPLTDIDTIDSTDGKINNMSALSIILNSDTPEHLSMLDGLLYQLLHEKWKEYAKIRFYQQAFVFIIYLIIFVVAVLLQPSQPQIEIGNSTVYIDECYLLAPSDSQQIARFVLEILTIIGAIMYLGLTCIDIHNETFSSFLHAIVNAPSKGIFLISCVFIIAVIPCRFTCTLVAENVILTLAIFTCFPYLFFFCRGFKLVGPFIIAIYKMITGDLLRFLLIYVVFLLGFSQAMYVVFRGTPHFLFSYPVLSVLGMFMIALGEFSDLYADFDSTSQPNAAKFLFVIYIILVTLLLINVLIAMFGNTFTTIADTRWEWQRQWAKIVLVIEQSVSPEHRKRKLRKYSILDKGKRWFVVRKSKGNISNDLTCFYV